MTYNYRKLLGRITEKYGTQTVFAKALGLSERSLSLKLTNKVGFKQSEIARACSLLEIPESEMHNYFFTHEVQQR